MLITFPHLGNLYIGVRIFLEELGLSYVTPPFADQDTLKLGARFAPESACLPLKIMSGNLIQARELGADTVLMLGSWGPCRFGYYCRMLEEILEEAGCPMDFIVLESCPGNPGELLRRLAKLGGQAGPLSLLKAFRDAGRAIRLADEVEARYFQVKPYESEKGSGDRVYKKMRQAARSAVSAKELWQALYDARDGLSALDTDKSARPLRVGLVGEIYGGIEPFAGMFIRDSLSSLGVETVRLLSASKWMGDNLIKLPFKKERDYSEAAAPYLATASPLGGTVRETLGHTVLHAREGLDGVVQVYPLGCAPEIVAQAILPAVARDYDLPLLTIVTDEMRGDSGYLTRIEAFIDLLQQRREAGLKVGPPGEET